MKKIIFLIVVCLGFFTGNAKSQNAYIYGATNVTPGSVESYNVYFDLQTYNVQYEVAGGTVLNSGYDFVTIQWDNTPGFYGYIQVWDLENFQSGVLDIYIGTAMPSVTPIYQTSHYNSNPLPLEIIWSFQPSPSSTITYQWYTGSGTAIPNTNNPIFYPPVQTTYLQSFFCEVTVDGSIFATDVCYININEFTAGLISFLQQPQYNGVAQISSIQADGGLCNSYEYSWEQSIDGATWSVIGNTENYPPNNIITDRTLIRRKVTCSNQTLISNTIELNPSYTPVDFENKNYVRENTIVVKGIKGWNSADLLPIGKKFTSTTYIDGLGRSIQKIEKEISVNSQGTWADFVSFSDYDEVGRTPKTYLPYPSATNIGKYKENNITELNSFVQMKFNDTHPYSQVNYDNSSLQRITSVYAPGSSWSGSNLGSSYQYDFNTANENIRIWTIGYAENSIPVSASADIYPDMKLYKTVTVDENSKMVIEYKDSEGNIILRKVQDKEQGPGLTNQHAGWACTYYVYDDFNQLRFVISPRAVEWLDANNWALSSNISIVNDLCFWYEFDERGRTIRKKSPGAAPVEFVYDERDRIVYTQDGKQRQAGVNKWETILYDNLDRPVITGIITYSNGRSALQTFVSGILNDGTNYSFNVTTDGNQNHTLQLNNSNVLPSGSNFEVMSITYYDAYNYPRVKNYTSSFVIDNTVPTDEIMTVDKSERTVGMVTGTFVKVLDGGNKFLATTYYYNNEGHTIQTHSENLFNQVDITTVQYDFAGRIRSSYSTHIANNLGAINIFNRNVLDKIGRVITIKESINGFYSKDLVEYSYDELGAVKKKRLAPGIGGDDGPELETQDFEYNIRGWLTGINKIYANQSAQTGRYFGMEIGYDKSGANFTKTEKNGNIAGIVWKTRGDNIQRRYEYIYDNKDQLINADFKQRNTSGALWTNDKANFSSAFTYDNNGNLKTFVQYGVVPGQGVQQTDNLSYFYKNSEWSNQLLRVDEAVTGTWNGKLGDFKNGANGNGAIDYDYNEDGQLIKDLNKEIDNGSVGGIEYNILGMPAKVTFNNTGKTITYIYDASGTKLKKIMNYPGASEYVVTDYVDDFIYSNGNLEFFGHAEGRVRIVLPTYSGGGAINYLQNGVPIAAGKIGIYDYYIKDHLNSIRMILTEEEHQTNAKATMEDANATSEEPYFGSEVITTSTVKPTGPTGWDQNISNKVSRLSTIGNDKQVGPNILMKVMSGDKISALTNYFFTDAGAGQGSNILNSITNALVNSLTSNAAPSLLIKQNYAILQNQFNGAGTLKSFIETPAGITDKPNAYLTMLFFDEQFNFVPQNSIRLQVEHGGDGNYNLPIYNQTAPQNGYVFVFLSNESNKYVYFDDFQVTHNRGRIIEENHYYAYGSNISAISASAMPSLLGGAKQNSRVNYGYQGEYSEEDMDTQWNEFDLRTYDPQIGRFLSADPYDEFENNYIGMGNNPITRVDPNGGYSAFYLTASTLIGAAIGYFDAVNANKDDDPDNDKNVLRSTLIGAGIGLGTGILTNALLNRIFTETYLNGAAGSYGVNFNHRGFDAWLSDGFKTLFSSDKIWYDGIPYDKLVAVDMPSINININQSNVIRQINAVGNDLIETNTRIFIRDFYFSRQYGGEFFQFLVLNGSKTKDRISVFQDDKLVYQDKPDKFYSKEIKSSKKNKPKPTKFKYHTDRNTDYVESQVIKRTSTNGIIDETIIKPRSLSEVTITPVVRIKVRVYYKMKRPWKPLN